MKLKKQKVLITGGAGFIGSRLAVRLSQRGHFVTIFDNLSIQIHGKKPKIPSMLNLQKSNLRNKTGSILCRKQLQRVLSEQDIVVHLAAETGTGQSMYKIERYTNVNVRGTGLLLDLIANNPCRIRKIIVASSRAVYGEGKYKCKIHGSQYPPSRSTLALSQNKFELICPICKKSLKRVLTDESSALRPSSVYGVTKLAQEQMVLSVGKALGISSLAFRYQNVYGPGQSLLNPYTGIISIFANRIRQNKPINIFEDGLESRDFVFIDDVVEATVLGLENPEPMLDIFNVGSGVFTDVIGVAKTLLRILKGKSEIKITGQYRVGDIRHNAADLTKISKTIGFYPKTFLHKGLSSFCNWVLNQKISEDRYEESLNELKTKALLQ